MKRYICQYSDTLVDAYYDGELSPEEAREYKSHLNECPECAQRLKDYNSISNSLEAFSRQELHLGEVISLWPEIRDQLEDIPLKSRQSGSRRLFLLHRPAWLGLALSAAAALILFFSGVFQSNKLPANYCRIENIAVPEHNYMIYKDKSDGFTIIWIME